MTKKTLKSIWAVLAGFLTVVILSVIADKVLEIVGVFPPPTLGIDNPGLLFTALVYRSIFTIIGGFVTAKLAPSNPKKHVIILAIIGLVAGLAGVVGGWNLSAHWYPIALAITGPLFVLLGGKLEFTKLQKGGR